MEQGRVQFPTYGKKLKGVPVVPFPGRSHASYGHGAGFVVNGTAQASNMFAIET